MMTRILCALGMLVMLSTAAHAENFSATLDGLQENPPVATPGSGTGTASYDPLTQMLSVDVNFSSLVGNTTNAHIHCCAGDALMNAGIAVHFVPHGFPLGVTSGSFSHQFDLSMASTYDANFLMASGGTAEQARDRLLDAMRNGVANNMNIAYFNIHTSFRPGGEIRGNIVPEPAAALFVLFSLLPMAWRRAAR